MRDSLIKRLSNKHLGRLGHLKQIFLLDRRAGVDRLRLLRPERVENHRNAGPSGRNSASKAFEGKLQGPAGCQRLPQIGEALGMHIFLRTYFSLYIEPAHQYVFDQRLRAQTQTRRTARRMAIAGLLNAQNQLKLVFGGSVLLGDGWHRYLGTYQFPPIAGSEQG